MTDALDETPLTVVASNGRDVGKTFLIEEMDALTVAGFVLRLVAALRIDSYGDLLAGLNPENSDRAPIDVIMHTLQGGDPGALHAIITDVLNYVKCAPDPRHPGAFRALVATDMRELRTLGEVLGTLARRHFMGL